MTATPRANPVAKGILLAFTCAAIAFAAFIWLTAPRPVIGPDNTMPSGDASRGEYIFAAGGCASCHINESGALSGGQALKSPFGTFYAPNISSHPEHGIGGWSSAQIVNAVMAGLSPTGQHYYPAFPYASYENMSLQDATDLAAYLQTLPPDPTPSRVHDLGFPFTIRRGLGLWKQLFSGRSWALENPATPEQERGRYLVEALGHCGECHTPRNALGGLARENWLRGAEHPSGEGRIPSIHPDDLGWSAADIAYYLQSGFTPEFDSAGGEMAEVIKNTSRLSDADREAIAAYLTAF